MSKHYDVRPFTHTWANGEVWGGFEVFVVATGQAYKRYPRRETAMRNCAAMNREWAAFEARKATSGPAGAMPAGG